MLLLTALCNLQACRGQTSNMLLIHLGCLISQACRPVAQPHPAVFPPLFNLLLTHPWLLLFHALAGLLHSRMLLSPPALYNLLLTHPWLLILHACRPPT
jgi:hypothetical protein